MGRAINPHASIELIQLLNEVLGKKLNVREQNRFLYTASFSFNRGIGASLPTDERSLLSEIWVIAFFAVIKAFIFGPTGKKGHAHIRESLPTMRT